MRNRASIAAGIRVHQVRKVASSQDYTCNLLPGIIYIMSLLTSLIPRGYSESRLLFFVSFRLCMQVPEYLTHKISLNRTENFLIIITACIPTLKPLYRRVFDLYTQYTHDRKANTYERHDREDSTIKLAGTHSSTFS